MAVFNLSIKMLVILLAEGMENSSVKSDCKGLLKDVSVWFREENDTAHFW